MEETLAGLDSVPIVTGEQLDYLRAHEDISLVAYSPILKGIYDDPAIEFIGNSAEAESFTWLSWGTKQPAISR